MSRTDAHRPWPVQLADPHIRHRLYRFQAYATEAPILVPWKNIACGCAMCTGRHERREERRRGRHEARRAIRKESWDAL